MGNSTGTCIPTDSDGDGFACDAFAAAYQQCDKPSSATDLDISDELWVLSQGDCNEDDNSINEGALEVCDLSDLDENCNGLSDDDDDSVTGAFAYYGDADNDGFGNEDIKTVSCDGGTSSSATNFLLLYSYEVDAGQALLDDGSTTTDTCLCADEDCSVGCRLDGDPTTTCAPLEDAECSQSNSPIDPGSTNSPHADFLRSIL